MSRSLQAVNKDWASPWGVHLSCCQELILQALVVCHVGAKEIVGRLQRSFPRIVHWRLSWYHMIFLLFATCFQDEPNLLPVKVWVKPFPWMITKWIIKIIKKPYPASLLFEKHRCVDQASLEFEAHCPRSLVHGCMDGSWHLRPCGLDVYNPCDFPVGFVFQN